MLSVLGKNQLLFTGEAQAGDEDEKPPKSYLDQDWKVMVIDDEHHIHDVTRIVLSDLVFENRKLQIISGYSAEDAKKLIRTHPDTALMLLDVVMESDHAGLEVVKYVRETLKNAYVRIILRTGQPGYAPEHQVISSYDINDYKEKTELTAQKLYTSVLTSLRSYRDLVRLSTLTMSNETLENLVEKKTEELINANCELKKEIQERTVLNEMLSKSEERMEIAQQIANVGHWELDLSANRIFCSHQTLRILGLDLERDYFSVDEFMAHVHGEERERVKAVIAHALAKKIPYNLEHKIIRPDGGVRHVRQQGKPFVDAQGNIERIIGVLQDVTEAWIASQQAKKLSSAVEQTADIIVITNHDGVIEYVNPAFSKVTGYGKQEVLGKTPNFLKSGKHSDVFYKKLWSTVLKGDVFNDILINKKKDGTLYYEEKTISLLKNSAGDVTHFISTGKDITERMEAQRKLYHLAHHDPLTNLPNRTLLLDRLEQAIARARWRERKVAVLFLDLDRFKVINDTLGHHIGDDLLKDVAMRLAMCIREGDTVCRLGGDEFCIILNDIASEADMAPIITKMLHSLEQPFFLHNHELFITSSLGVSLFPNDGYDCNTLLKKADVAMYRSKNRGGNNYCLYTSDDEAKAVQRLSLETNLRYALDRDEFQLHYQPQLRLTDGRVEGMEALLRWFHPTFPGISPVQFIPLLEETGMIIPVGEWVIHEACRYERQRQDKGLEPYRVAVNLSIRQFRQKNLVSVINGILDDTKLDPQYLELEVTEGLLIDNIKEASQILLSLHDLGIRLSIDDFGTGYSSLNYLKRLPFDTLKIDYSFVRDVVINEDDAAITSAIITLGHQMGLEVVAEGVENLKQFNYLRAQGCDKVQGFYCSPPLAPAQMDIFGSWFKGM